MCWFELVACEDVSLVWVRAADPSKIMLILCLTSLFHRDTKWCNVIILQVSHSITINILIIFIIIQCLVVYLCALSYNWECTSSTSLVEHQGALSQLNQHVCAQVAASCSGLSHSCRGCEWLVPFNEFYHTPGCCLSDHETFLFSHRDHLTEGYVMINGLYCSYNIHLIMISCWIIKKSHSYLADFISRASE